MKSKVNPWDLLPLYEIRIPRKCVLFSTIMFSKQLSAQRVKKKGNVVLKADCGGGIQIEGGW